MDTIVTIGNYKLKQWEKRAMNVSRVNQLNGFYLYGPQTAHINVASYDFQNRSTENGLITLFAKVVTHETLHHAISLCTDKCNLPGEEDLVLRLSGQRR